MPSIKSNRDGVNVIEVGHRGPRGPAGPGLPTGGEAGQVLTKASGADSDTEWADAPGDDDIAIDDVDGLNAILATKASLGGLNAQTGSYTLGLGDIGGVVEIDSATASSLTIPPSSAVNFVIGSTAKVSRMGDGAVAFVPGPGVTILRPGNLTISHRYGVVDLYYRGANVWVASGDLTVAEDGDPPFMSDIADLTVTFGTAISVNAAAYTTGEDITYSMSGAPGWLSINPATGMITGTAPASASTSSITVTATNDHGSDSDGFSLVVEAEPEISLPSDPSIWAIWEADAPANGAAVTAINFTGAEVDTAANTINLGVTSFGAFGTYASALGTPMVYSTTGTPIGGLQDGEAYYLSLVSGTLYHIYPVATDEDAAALPGFTAADNIAPGQKFAQRAGAVDLTSGGSGTHTFTSREITPNLVDAVNGYLAQAKGVANKNTWLEIDTDGDGHKFVRSGRIAKDHLGDGVYDFYGKTFDIKPNSGGTNLDVKNNIGNKRFIFESYVVAIEPYVTRGNPKAPLDPSKVNTTTNLFTSTAHPLNTGDMVRLKLDAGSTPPSPLAEDTNYWLRDISANTFSLHPTQADAAANTNAIDITTTGSGTFTVYAPRRVADSNRMSFFAEIIEPNGGQNTLSPNLTYSGPTSVGRVSPTSTAIPLTGNNPGNLNQQKAFVDYGHAVVKVDVYVPPEGAGPTCTDTGLPLTSGTYWLTRSGGSSTYARLHRTAEAAQAAVGLENAALSSSQMIKFSDIGNTEFMLNFHPDMGTPFNFNYYGVSGTEGIINTLLPFNRRTAITFGVDFNDPNPAVSTVQLYLYVHGELAGSKSTSTPKGNTPAAVTGSPGTLMNSAASHVPFIGKWYAGFFGSHVSAVPAEALDEIHAYLMSKYEIS